MSCLNPKSLNTLPKSFIEPTVAYVICPISLDFIDAEYILACPPNAVNLLKFCSNSSLEGCSTRVGSDNELAMCYDKRFPKSSRSYDNTRLRTTLEIFLTQFHRCYLIRS